MNTKPDYFRIDSAMKYARTLADQSNLTVRFHNESMKFYTDGKVINVPDPAVGDDLDIWMYGLVHEIQHNDPAYRKFMHITECTHRYILNNVLTDYQHEAGLYGKYSGKDRIVQTGREKFLAATANVAPPPKNDFEALMAALYRACDQIRSEQWDMFNPTLRNDQGIAAMSDDIRKCFDSRIKGTVSHGVTDQKKLIEDLISKYVKDSSAPKTEQEGKQKAEEAQAAGAAAAKALQDAIGKAMKQAQGVDTHGDAQGKVHANNTQMSVHAPGSGKGYGNADIRPWIYTDQHTIQTPNISEQVRKLLLAKKQKSFENNKNKGKFRSAGITKLFNHDLNVFSKKTEALSYNTDVVVAVDCSGSMHGVKIEAARNACSGFVNVLQDLQARYGVLLYEGHLYWLKTPDQHMNKGEIEKKISTIADIGGTMTNHALVEAAHSLSNSKNRAIILLTDGSADDKLPGSFGPGYRGFTPDLIKNLEKHGYRVYTVIIEDKHMYYAFKGEGVRVCFVDNSSELPAAMMDIVQDIYVR